MAVIYGVRLSYRRSRPPTPALVAVWEITRRTNSMMEGYFHESDGGLIGPFDKAQDALASLRCTVQVETDPVMWEIAIGPGP